LRALSGGGPRATSLSDGQTCRTDLSLLAPPPESARKVTPPRRTDLSPLDAHRHQSPSMKADMDLLGDTAVTAYRQAITKANKKKMTAKQKEEEDPNPKKKTKTENPKNTKKANIKPDDTEEQEVAKARAPTHTTHV
jgi:hypothetical protein